MIEEPYRWVEAIANRREYIETQLAGGSPIVAVSCSDGVLLATFGRGRQKIFEIYDRIALGAIGHPGDIERLRMAAIELASTEGFTRSAADVSLRRLAHYSLSPVLKTAFEQVYGAPYLARLLFAEVGEAPEDDLFLQIDYDGSIATNTRSATGFAIISPTSASAEAASNFLGERLKANSTLKRALDVAVSALTVARIAARDGCGSEPVKGDAFRSERDEQLKIGSPEAALLERTSARTVRFRPLLEPEIAAAIGA